MVGVEGDENAMFRLGRLKKEFQTLVTTNVRVRVRELTSLRSGRKSLASIAARAGTYFASAEVSLSDLEIEMNEDKTSAKVRCLATLTAQQGGRMRRDERQVDFTLAKVDGDWLIDSIIVSDVGEDP